MIFSWWNCKDLCFLRDYGSLSIPTHTLRSRYIYPFQRKNSNSPNSICNTAFYYLRSFCRNCDAFSRYSLFPSRTCNLLCWAYWKSYYKKRFEARAKNHENSSVKIHIQKRSFTKSFFFYSFIYQIAASEHFSKEWISVVHSFNICSQ